MNNLYFLVEGHSTEMKVYPKWLAHLLPHYTRVNRYGDAKVNNYFFLSGEGYPQLLQFLEDAITNVNAAGCYSHLVVCVDAEEDTPADRIGEIEVEISRNKWSLGSCRLEIMVQNRCIETWFLGNRRVVARNPQSKTLAAYLRHHDVRTDDPELMACHPDFELNASFHEAYLKEIFRERGAALYQKASRPCLRYGLPYRTLPACDRPSE